MPENNDERAWLIRNALAQLVVDTRYSMTDIAERTGTRYRSVRRYLTMTGADADLPPLPFVITLLGVMSDDESVPQVESPGQWLDDTLRQFPG